MNTVTRRLLTNIRCLLAGISEEIFYYLALFAAFCAWVYFKSIYAAILVGIAGIALAWCVSALIEGKGENKDGL